MASTRSGDNVSRAFQSLTGLKAEKIKKDTEEITLALLDPNDIMGTQSNWLSSMVAYGYDASQGYNENVDAYLNLYREAEGYTGNKPTDYTEPFNVEAFISRAMGAGPYNLVGKLIKRGKLSIILEPDNEAFRQVIGAIKGDMVTEVFRSGRRSILLAGVQEKDVKGWRRDTNPGACTFCLMLATRGMAGTYGYRTEVSASFQPHTSCQCTPELIGAGWAPRLDQILGYQTFLEREDNLRSTGLTNLETRKLKKAMERLKRNDEKKKEGELAIKASEALKELVKA